VDPDDLSQESERTELADPAVQEEPLPTMADLDRVGGELDQIDQELAALDEQRP